MSANPVLYRRPDGTLVNADGRPVNIDALPEAPVFQVTYRRQDGTEVYPDGSPVAAEESEVGRQNPASFVAQVAITGTPDRPAQMSPGELAVASMGYLDEVEPHLADLTPEDQADLRQQVRQSVQNEHVAAQAEGRTEQTPRLDPATRARLQAAIDNDELNEGAGEDEDEGGTEHTGQAEGAQAPETTDAPGATEPETTEPDNTTGEAPANPRARRNK